MAFILFANPKRTSINSSHFSRGPQALFPWGGWYERGAVNSIFCGGSGSFGMKTRVLVDDMYTWNSGRFISLEIFATHRCVSL